MEINIGSNIIRNTNGVLNVEGKDQISLEVREDGQLLVTMDIYDDAGKHPARLLRNAWTFNKGDRFSVTTNPSDLSLTDSSTGEIVVRVRVIDRGHLEVPEGRFYTHKGHLLEITPEYWRVAGIITMSGNTIDSCDGAVSIS